MNKKFEAIIFIGVQATGKSTFYKEKYFNTHIRINLDMLRTRNREKQLLEYCINCSQSFVIDNTNPTKEERIKYIEKIPKQNFEITCYYFKSNIEEIKIRNEQRSGKENIPLVGILSTYKKLERPTYEEGFDKIIYVEIDENGKFIEKEWENEI